MGKIESRELVLEVRDATSTDLAEIAKLTQAAYQKGYKPDTTITTANDTTETISSEVESGAKIILTSIDGKVVGAIRYRINDDSLYFYRLAVIPEFRNRGIAEGLIERVSAIAHDHKLKKIIIDVAEEKGLMPYYAKFGFKPTIVKAKKHHHGETLTEWQMEKEL